MREARVRLRDTQLSNIRSVAKNTGTTLKNKSEKLFFLNYF